MSFFLLFFAYELKSSYLVSNAIIFKILKFFCQFENKLLPLPSQYLHAVGDGVTKFAEISARCQCLMVLSFVSTKLAPYNDEPNNTSSPYNMFLVKEDIRPIKTLTSSANFFLLPIQFQGKSSQRGRL